MPRLRNSSRKNLLQGTEPQTAAPVLSVIAAGKPRLPKDLKPEALAVFKKLCAMLRKRRQLTAEDGELIRLYAITHERHAKSVAKIQAEGEIRIYTRMDSNGQPHDIEKENLWLRVAVNCEKNMVAILDRLGLTSINRDRVKLTPQAAPKAEFPEGSYGWYQQNKEAVDAAAQKEQETQAPTFSESEVDFNA